MSDETPPDIDPHLVLIQELIGALTDVLREFAPSELEAAAADPAFYADRFREWLREVIE